MQKKRNILYVHDFCFYRENGSNYFYTAVGLPEEYFDRFFESGYEVVNLVTRNQISEAKQICNAGFKKIENVNINIPVQIENYKSLIKPSVFLGIKSQIKNCDLLVINFPSVIGVFVYFINLFLKKQYTVEAAADYDQFSSKRFGGFLSQIIKFIYPKITNSASGVIYVSNYLSLKYPCSNSLVASNVKINKVYLPRKLTRLLKENELIKLTFVGGVNKRKGIKELINSINELRERGYNNIKLFIIGGHFDDDYSKYVSSLNLEHSVSFKGILSTQKIQEVLKETDIYIQPSHSEGIPRATLEAMSHAIPVVATALPGFKEILNFEFLVQPSNHKELADKIEQLIVNNEVYNIESNRNVSMAKNFLHDNLNSNRKLFYSKF